MLPSENSPSAAGTSRRTVLKGAAWAAPVIAATTAVPFAAATNGATALLLSSWGFATVWAHNADGTRRFTLSRPLSTTLSVTGETALAGAVIQLSFDARMFEAPRAMIDGQQLISSSSTSNGVTTVTYTIDFELPVGPGGFGSFALTFSSETDYNRVWPAGETVAPIVLEIVPAVGSSAGSSGSIEQFNAQFVDTHDLALIDPQVTTYDIRDGQGNYRRVELVTGVTITNLGPASFPSDVTSSLSMFYSPDVVQDGASPTGPALVTNVQAFRGGVPVATTVTSPAWRNQVYVEFPAYALAPGEQVEVSWQLDLLMHGSANSVSSIIGGWVQGENENPVTVNGEVRNASGRIYDWPLAN